MSSRADREARRKLDATRQLTRADLIEMLARQGWQPPIQVATVTGDDLRLVQYLFECEPYSTARAEAWGVIGCEVTLDAEQRAEVEAGTRDLVSMACEAAIKAIIEREQRQARPSGIILP